MSEPEFIRNTAPHEISMPVGGRNAMGKSAHVGEPTIHRVLAEDDADLTAPPTPAENSTAADTPPLQRKAATLAVDETANPVAPAKDKLADTPVPQASEHAIAVAADLKAQISDELSALLASEHAITVAADLKVQISDELAARLIALKTENDQVLQQLDGLEKLLAIQP